MSTDIYSVELFTALETSAEEIATALGAVIGGAAIIGFLALLFQFCGHFLTEFRSDGIEELINTEGD